MPEVDVVVIGSQHHNTLGVVRSLGEAGIQKSNLHVLLVNKDHLIKNLISSSRYVDTNNISFVDSYAGIAGWLVSHGDVEKKKVVICCSDGSAEAVINAREKLHGQYICPDTVLPISQLAHKSYQGEIARESGLTVPVSADFSIDRPIEWNTFPCIIKPYKIATGAGKNDVRISRSKEELDNSLVSLGSETIQIQQYIDKEIEFQLIGCSFNAGDRIIIPGFTRLIRQPKNTNTGYLLYSPIEQLDYNKDAVERFIRTIGYSGLFSVEFIRGKDGKDYFLEINMRNDGNAYCVESAGVNLPYIWSYYQTYGELPDVPTTFEKPVYFIPDFNDLKIAIKTVGLPKWIKQFRQADSHSIYNKNDMGPFRFECKRVIKKLFKM